MVLPVVYLANPKALVVVLGESHARWSLDLASTATGHDAGTWRDVGATAAGLGAMQGTAAPGRWRGGRAIGEAEIHRILAEHAGGNVVRPKGAEAMAPWMSGSGGSGSREGGSGGT